MGSQVNYKVSLRCCGKWVQLINHIKVLNKAFGIYKYIFSKTQIKLLHIRINFTTWNTHKVCQVIVLVMS